MDTSPAQRSVIPKEFPVVDVNTHPQTQPLLSITSTKVHEQQGALGPIHGHHCSATHSLGNGGGNDIEMMPMGNRLVGLSYDSKCEDKYDGDSSSSDSSSNYHDISGTATARNCIGVDISYSRRDFKTGELEKTQRRYEQLQSNINLSSGSSHCEQVVPSAPELDDLGSGDLKESGISSRDNGGRVAVTQDLSTEQRQFLMTNSSDADFLREKARLVLGNPPIAPMPQLSYKSNSSFKTPKRDYEHKQGKIEKHSSARYENLYRSGERVARQNLALPAEAGAWKASMSDWTCMATSAFESKGVDGAGSGSVAFTAVVTPSAPVTYLKQHGSMAIVNIQHRMVQVNRLKTYSFPRLDFLGIWRNLTHSEPPEIYPDQWGVFIDQGRLSIQLPETIVDELAAWWSHKPRSADFSEFLTSVAKLKQIMYDVVLPSDVVARTVLYAPVIAYMHTWREQQFVSRVLKRSYWSSDNWNDTLSMNLLAFHNASTLLQLCIIWGMCCAFLLVFGSFGLMVMSVGGVTQLMFSGLLFQCLVVPISEELLKRTRLANLFIWIEFVVYSWWGIFSGMPVERVLIMRGAMVVMHKMWQKGDLIPSIALHGTWNYLVFLGVNPVVNTLMNTGWLNFSEVFKATTGFLSHPGSASLGMASILGHVFNHVNTKPACIKKIPFVNVVCDKSGGLKDKAKVRLMPQDLRGKYRAPDAIVGDMTQLAFDTGKYAPNAYADNQNNEYEALYARVLVDTPVPDSTYLNKFIKFVKSNVREIYPRVLNVKSISFESYLEGSNASPAVKQILRDTHIKLLAEGINEHTNLTEAQRYFYTKRKSFIKKEGSLYCTPAGTKRKAPRLIQGAPPEFVCLVGPWIAALQQVIKRRWGINNFMCYTSGVTAKDAASVINEPSWFKLEDDISKNDASYRMLLCELEVWLAKYFGAPRAVLQLMRANIKTHGATQRGFKYSVDGGRKSGDPYTSLFNSTMNGMMHLFVYCDETGKTVAMARSTLRMLLQGDDNVLVHDDEHKIDFKGNMSKLGFECKAIYRDHLDELEFCSNLLYDTNEGPVFGPKPGRVLAKLGHVVNSPDVDRDSLMRGIALGLYKACHFIPPIKVVLDRVLFLTQGKNPIYLKAYDAHKLRFRACERNFMVTPEIWLMLDKRYGWDSRIQSRFGEVVNTLQFGDKMDHSYAQMLFDRDTSGPPAIFVPV